MVNKCYKKLSDICSLIADCVNKTAPKVDFVTPYKMLRTTNIKNGYIDFENVSYVTKEIFEKWTRRCLPQYGDIILTREAPVGEIGRFNIDSDNYFLGQRLFLYRANPELLDWNYLAYALLSPEMKGILSGISNGSTVAHIKVPDAEHLKIPYFPIKFQRKIGKILSNYDDLIENNNRRIKILEEMAQKIYKEWFVDFKFPGHETTKFKDSPLGKIPNEWNVMNANSIANIFIGRTPSRKDFSCFTTNNKDKKWISIKDIGLSNEFIFKTSEYLTNEAIKKYNIPLIPKDTVILSFKLTVGKVTITTEEMYSNEAIAQFQIKDIKIISTFYLYLYLKNFEYTNLGNTSSIGNAINSSIVKNMSILIPKASILFQFNKNIDDLFNQIKILSIKNENLKQTRDILLPRLISGEINVENMEII